MLTVLSMNNEIGRYINELAANAGLSQADLAREINISRQLLSYVILGKREMSLKVAMRLESYFSLPYGKLMKMQAVLAVQRRKSQIRDQLCDKLVSKNAFWSFDIKTYDSIPDDEIIEKCFTVLDMDDIDLMFEIYPRKQILQVWREKMAIQGEYMQMLNIMIAMYYFGIKEPEKYLARIEKQHVRNLLKDSSYASGING